MSEGRSEPWSGAHACCIGHDHAHVVVARHERTIERIASHLKSKATMELTREDVYPLKTFRKPGGAVPTPWSEGVWSVFVNDLEQLRCAIRYVERHPEEERLSPQHFDFVTPFPG